MSEFSIFWVLRENRQLTVGVVGNKGEAVTVEGGAHVSLGDSETNGVGDTCESEAVSE